MIFHGVSCCLSVASYPQASVYGIVNLVPSNLPRSLITLSPKDRVCKTRAIDIPKPIGIDLYTNTSFGPIREN